MLICSHSEMYLLIMQHLLINVQASAVTFLALKEQLKVTKQNLFSFSNFRRKTIQILFCHWFYKTNKSVCTTELHHIIERVCTEKGEVLDRCVSLVSCQRSMISVKRTQLSHSGDHIHTV